MQKQIFFVTSNKGKLETAQRYFNEETKLEFYDYDIVEPKVNDIEYIAEYKVKEAFKKVGKPCISLDAGFFILNFPGKPNFPGAFPRREILEKLGIDGVLKKMENVEDRQCYFKECLAYYDGKTLKKFFGISEGSLSKEKRGLETDKKWSDLWYIFIPKNNVKTLAEMTDKEREERADGHISPFKELSEWLKK